MKKDTVSIEGFNKQQLNHELANRSSSSELENRGLIKPAQSSVLAGRIVELEHNFKKDSIHRELENRPDREELINRGMLSRSFYLFIKKILMLVTAWPQKCMIWIRR